MADDARNGAGALRRNHKPAESASGQLTTCFLPAKPVCLKLPRKGFPKLAMLTE